LILDTKNIQDVEEVIVEDAEGDKLKDGQGEKVEDVQGEIAAESSSKLLDDASSTEDEDIRLVVEDASDETDTEPQVAKTPEINTEETEKLLDTSDEVIEVENEEPIKASTDADKDIEKTPENPLENELLSDDEPKIISEKPLEKVLSDDIQDPSSPMGSGIALDNITSNFDEDSCTSFDKSLEEIDPKKTEDINETPKDDVPVEKIPDEAVIIEPEVIAKANSNDEVTAMDINEVEENKKEIMTGKINI
jgi:hypothetical protein